MCVRAALSFSLPLPLPFSLPELRAARGVLRALVAFAAPVPSVCARVCCCCYLLAYSFPLFLFARLFNALGCNTLRAFVECMRINASLFCASI
jgi:hypothetical protein